VSDTHLFWGVSVLIKDDESKVVWMKLKETMMMMMISELRWDEEGLWKSMRWNQVGLVQLWCRWEWNVHRSLSYRRVLWQEPIRVATRLPFLVGLASVEGSPSAFLSLFRFRLLLSFSAEWVYHFFFTIFDLYLVWIHIFYLNYLE